MITTIYGLLFHGKSCSFEIQYPALGRQTHAFTENNNITLCELTNKVEVLYLHKQF